MQDNILKLVSGTKPICISHCFRNRDACAVHQIVCYASPVPRKHFCESNALINFVSLKSGLQLVTSEIWIWKSTAFKFLDIEVAECSKLHDLLLPNYHLTYKIHNYIKRALISFLFLILLVFSTSVGLIT